MKKQTYQGVKKKLSQIGTVALAIVMVVSLAFAGIPVFADTFTPTYVAAYDGTPVGNTYTADEVSGKEPENIISGQRVKVTAPFSGFQIYMSNGNAYSFTLSVYKWTDDYDTTIKTTPLKTADKTTTSGAVRAESLTWTDGALEAGEYLFVVENARSKSTVTTNPNRLGLAEVASNVSKGEYYRVGKLTTGKELALDIMFTQVASESGYYLDVFKQSYVAAYDGTPVGNTYTADEVSGKKPENIISGQRVKVTAPFSGFQIYMSNGNSYYFTLSVYKWTDDYETTIAAEPLKTKDMTLTNGAVQAKTLKWSDGALEAGEYFFVVENVKSKDTVTTNPNRLGLAEVASNVSKGEYYRVGKSTTGKELALDIFFTEAAPESGYYSDVFKATYVAAYDGTPTGNTYTQDEVSGKKPEDIISGQRVKVTAPFNGFKIYMASGNVYNFTLSVYKWTDDYETTIAAEPLKTKDMTLTNGAVQAKEFKWTDGALEAGEYFFVVENTKSKDSVTDRPNRLGLAEVASNVSKGEYYRVGKSTTGKELALDIFFTEAAPESGYYLDVFKVSYVAAYDGTPTGNNYTATEVSGKNPEDIISGQRVKVTAPFSGFQIYMANGNAYYFTLSVYKWTDDYDTTIASAPLKTKDMTLTNGAVQAKTLKWTDGALEAGEYFFVVENVKSKDTVTTNPNRLGLAEVESNVSKGEYYRVGKLTTGKELALDIMFTEAAPESGYYLDVFKLAYVAAYDGTPTGNTYTAAEVSGKNPEDIISGQRVKVTAPFNGFQIYMSNGNAYYFTLSVYKWTDDYETTIAAEPLKTKDMTLTNGAVQAKEFKWTDGALEAGEYFFVVENTKSKDSVTDRPNRLGLAEVASNVSRGEYYRVGKLTTDKELALDILFTEAAPESGYFSDVFKPTYVAAYDGTPKGNTYTADEVSGKNPEEIISGQRVNVTAPFNGFQIYMSNGNVYNFTLSVYKWTDDYETTIASAPLKTKDMTLTNGVVEAKGFKWSDGALEAGEYFFVVENTKSKDTVTDRPNRLGLAEVESDASQGEYYRVGKLVRGKELALDILFTQASGTEGYFSFAKTIARGDFNVDGNIDVLDFIALNKQMVETTVDLETYDLNKDNTVDVKDLVMLKKYLLGLIDEFTSGGLTNNEVPPVLVG